MTENVRAATVMDAQEILRAAASLGFLGGSAQATPRILSMLCDPATDIRAVAALIERDPGLSLRVLRVANSAYYGMSRNVISINRALLLLGQDAVRGIAAAACMDRTLRAAQSSLPVNVDALVRHSLAVAVAAEAVLRRPAPAQAAEAFMAGLLHNLGIAVQLVLQPQLALQLRAAMQCHPDGSVRAAEAALGMVAHEHCVGVILERWHFPPLLTDVVSHHHAPALAPPASRPLATAVHVGLGLAAGAGRHFEIEPAAVATDQALMDAAGITAGDCAAVAADLPARLDTLLQALH
jgi:HD-like signal output (HDOD) protein